MRQDYERYLLAQLEDELFEVRDRLVALDSRLNRINSFWVLLLKQLFWTFSRIARDAVPEKTKTGVRAIANAIGVARPARADGRLGASSSQPAGAATGSLPSPRLLIDATILHRQGGVTGIQRVVREVVAAVSRSGEAIPVAISQGRLHQYLAAPDLGPVVEIAAGDRFVMIDACWNSASDYEEMMRVVAERGAVSVVVMYDLIPVLYPSAFADVSHAFADWLDTLAVRADAVVAISKSTADDFIAYTGARRRAGQKIGWWRLGGDFKIAAQHSVSSKLRAICADPSPFFLSVGTIEPRKGYPIALAAFQRLWNDGVDARYVIVGGSGWNTRALQSRIVEHPEFDRRLFWLENVHDADLRELYSAATRLIAPSFAEGFGLPLVEAAQFGLRAIASDIPVFREVGSADVVYFRALDDADLARCIREALTSTAHVASVPPLGWAESTRSLVALIRDDLYQYSPVDDGGAAVEAAPKR